MEPHVVKYLKESFYRESMNKVLILYNKLFHYRIPVFNILSEWCDLTVAYCYDSEVDMGKVKFKTLKLTPVKIGPFTLQRENIYKICKQYDSVIVYGELAWLKYILLPWNPFCMFRVLFWGIGVRASYKHSFDSKDPFLFVRKCLEKRADGLIFYSDYPVLVHENWGIDKKKLFVAHNTVAVKDIVKNNPMNILFIGTLYKGKGIQYLLDAYKEAYDVNPLLLDLKIVGGGDDFEQVKQWIQNNQLSSKITLYGSVYDDNLKARIWSEAIACISPQQAGLSVLESMGYATPFITTRKAITGGEIFNIKNGENGVLLDDVGGLVDVILDISKNTQKYLDMGRNARFYYENNRLPYHMAKGLYDSVSENLYK